MLRRLSTIVANLVIVLNRMVHMNDQIGIPTMISHLFKIGLIRVFNELRRSGLFRRDKGRELAPSYVDKTNNWVVSKKSIIGSKFVRKEGRFFQFIIES